MLHKCSNTAEYCPHNHHMWAYAPGNLIGIAKERLPVTVSFASPKPLSFTAALDFIDEEGKRYSVPVTGTTDNCMLTLHVSNGCGCPRDCGENGWGQETERQGRQGEGKRYLEARVRHHRQLHAHATREWL